MRRRPILVWPVGALLALGVGSAQADPSFSMRVEAGAAAPVGDQKSQQFGWGGTGALVPELALHEVFGVDFALGAVVLSDKAGGDPNGVRETGAGLAGFSTVGPRFRPLATLASRESPIDLDGLYLAAGVGAALTGDSLRPTVRTSLGWDAMSSVVAAGPFIGFVQVVEPDAGSLRPEDARIAMFGLSGTLLPASRQTSEPGDSDGDGVRDDVDRCPDSMEDKDGFQDEDGCPDTDDDQDGIADSVDQCPRIAEDKDGFEDEDGCPEFDNDRDGLVDKDDLCPNAAEDKDGFEDEDGCPDDDNDQDGVADAFDACPEERETPNGIRDDDGCPDTEDLHVAGDRIVLDERINFDLDSSQIHKDSFELVTRIAEFLVSHQEYSVVRVAGHADRSGTEEYNLKLSTSRAFSVKEYLIKKGVSAERLIVAGYGDTRPRQGEAAESPENRRVEIEIIKRRKRSQP